jgi:RNA polymerase sigma-70 factor (ECF subfamily)
MEHSDGSASQVQSEGETGAGTFEEHRPLLLGNAYRLTGSVMDAEDLVQETYVRWSRASRTDVHSPREYLATVATRLAINHLRSARVRREQYVGPWLPEPLLRAETPAPGDPVELAESLQTAFLVLLESLSPVERAAFLLREVFAYEYAEVARVLGKTDTNARKIVERARARISEGRSRFDPAPGQLVAVMESFVRACTSGDPSALLAVLAEDVTFVSDGGGRVPAALRPVVGASNVARLLLGLLAKTPPGVVTRIQQVNGQVGAVAYLEGCPFHVLTLAVAAGQVRTIYVVTNPDKLPRRAGPVAADAGPLH